MLDRFCASNWWIFRIDADDVAANRGKSSSQSFAKAHAVLAKFCRLKWRIRLMDCEDIACRSGSCQKFKAETDQDVIDSPRWTNCDSRVSAAAAIAFSNGSSHKSSLAHAHTVLGNSCADNSAQATERRQVSCESASPEATGTEGEHFASRFSAVTRLLVLNCPAHDSHSARTYALEVAATSSLLRCTCSGGKGRSCRVGVQACSCCTQD